MPKALFYEQGNPERARVILVHHQPDELEPERRAQGIEIDDAAMPVKDTDRIDQGYKPRLYVNTLTGEAWYEYVMTRERAMENRIAALEREIADLRR